jgi:hypothetical protein
MCHYLGHMECSKIMFLTNGELHIFQVILLSTYRIRMWFYLQPVKQRQTMNYDYNHLETVARDYTTSVAHCLIVEYVINVHHEL